MRETKLGEILTKEAGRDAVHIAVAPAIASHELHPGQHVGVSPDGLAAHAGNHIGVVDPFLKQSVKQGERFFVCLYPGTITSLRHEWTHPSFPVANPLVDKEMEQSERWLRMYAITHNCYTDDHEEAFQELIAGLRSGELFFHGSDLHGRYDLDDEWELKKHAETYLGIDIDFDRFTFSCSC